MEINTVGTAALDLVFKDCCVGVSEINIVAGKLIICSARRGLHVDISMLREDYESRKIHTRKKWWVGMSD